MEIILIRHGRPQLRDYGWLSPVAFGDWVADYNAAGIDTRCPPPAAALELARDCGVAVCSHYPRSLESARLLGVTAAADAEFREVDMPYGHWRLPYLTVPGWTLLFRLLQVVGYSRHGESLKAARRRAAECASRLVGLAQGQPSVLFVGHGSLNWLIARELRRQGWVGDGGRGRGYWGYRVFRKETA